MLRITEHTEGTACTLRTGTVEAGVRRAPTASTARQALRILELFSPDEPVLGVSEIGRRLGVHKSNISRLVAALQAEGFLARTENGRYRLGLRLFVMGASVTHSHSLYEAALSELSEVRIETGDSAHLAVLVDTEVVHLERIRSQHLLKSRIGSRSRPPVHASSTGKALLAHAPVEVRERVIASGLRRYTSRTITDPDEFRAELESVRLRGYALDRQEFLEGISSVAVPIVAKDHETMVAVAIVTGSDQLVGLHMRDTLRVLQDAATRIARRNS